MTKAIPVLVVLSLAIAAGWAVHVWSGAPRFEHADRFPQATRS